MVSVSETARKSDLSSLWSFPFPRENGFQKLRAAISFIYERVIYRIKVT